MDPHIVLDFDSTIVQCETLDKLAEIALSLDSDREEKIALIKKITDQGMEGTLSIEESLKQRLRLLTAHQSHIKTLISELPKSISPSFLRQKKFLSSNAHRITIISAGFLECIEPIARILGLSTSRIHANKLHYDTDGNILGIDPTLPLSKTKGKIHAIQLMNLSRPIHIVGDGFTDYEIFKEGYADAFYAYTETVERTHITSQPGVIVARSFEEYLSLTSQAYDR